MRSIIGFAASNKYATIALSVLFIGLLSSVVVQEDEPEIPQERINLALRQLGHKLLLEIGDSITTIPPVEQRGAATYFLPLGQLVNYDAFQTIGPKLLAEIGIQENYSLALLDRDTENIVLGFNWLNLKTNGQLACTERDQSMLCYDILLTLYPPKKASHTPTILIGATLLVLLLLLPKLLSNQSGKNSSAKGATMTASLAAPQLVQLSNSTAFDPLNQQLNTKEAIIKLTFREAKLLEYLVANKGEVLSREAIHAAVWGSEGVLVGRSLDVFISRLRKKLAKDSGIEIATIHGIGYRFLVND